MTTLTILGPLLGAALGVLIGYGLNARRMRYEKLYEKRGEVIAELNRLLSKVQATARLATQPLGIEQRLRELRIAENRAAFEEAIYYFQGHTLWLRLDLVRTIAEFLQGIAPALKEYEEEVKVGAPDSPRAAHAAEYVNRVVPQAEQLLEAEFRAILYPSPWWERPLRWLEWFEARNRKRGGG